MELTVILGASLAFLLAAFILLAVAAYVMVTK